tara:strand:+ start:37 stop:210 length:174 start_codon:yes stop_codon:yes gene_type:complete
VVKVADHKEEEKNVYKKRFNPKRRRVLQEEVEKVEEVEEVEEVEKVEEVEEVKEYNF